MSGLMVWSSYIGTELAVPASRRNEMLCVNLSKTSTKYKPVPFVVSDETDESNARRGHVQADKRDMILHQGREQRNV